MVDENEMEIARVQRHMDAIWNLMDRLGAYQVELSKWIRNYPIIADYGTDYNPDLLVQIGALRKAMNEETTRLGRVHTELRHSIRR